MTNYSCGIHINSPNTLCALSLRLKHSVQCYALQPCTLDCSCTSPHNMTPARHLLPRNKPDGGLSCSEILPQWRARAAALSPLWSLLSRGDYCRDDTPAAPSWWETSPMLFVFKYISPQAFSVSLQPLEASLIHGTVLFVSRRWFLWSFYYQHKGWIISSSFLFLQRQLVGFMKLK